jgi:signal transduction histidine kinase
VRWWSVRARAGAATRLGWRDWTVGGLAAAASAIQVSVGPSVERAVPFASVGALLGIAGGLALAWRRRRPVVVSALAVGTSGVQALVSGPALPVVGWLAVVALAWHASNLRTALRGAAAAAVAVAAVHTVAGLMYQRDVEPLVLSLTLVVLLGAALARLQRARADAQRREREAAREQAVTAERLRIAWDLHDLVGHGLSSVAIQSSTARLALDAGDAAAARRAVVSMEKASRVALAEMRQLLGVLRQGAVEAAPAPGLDAIQALADDASAAGHAVTVHRSGPLDGVPPAVSLCAYRVVQEALTNAVRHAPGAAIAISLQVAAHEFTVEVTDDGIDRPAGPASEEGGARYGLMGLAERVGTAGGTIDAGPRVDSPGWRVVARLPLAEEEP